MIKINNFSELQYLRTNDSAKLKGDVEEVFRKISLLDLKFTELLSNLKSDIQMDTSSHKSENKETNSKIELGTQEIQHELLIRLSNLKTDIEQMKVELTASIVWITLCCIATRISFIPNN